MRRSSPVIGGAHPHAQDIGAGLLDHVLRRGDVAERLRHFAAVLVEHEAVGENDVERRAAARAAGFQQRRLKPAAMLVGAFEIHHGFVAAVGLALECGERRESALASSSTKACVEPESNQTSRMSSTFCQPSLASLPRKRSRAPGAYQASAPSSSNASTMRALTSGSSRISTEPSGFLLDEHRDRHAPGALARDHPVGPALDHAVDAVLALLRHPARRLDRLFRELAQRQAMASRCRSAARSARPWR